MAVYYNEHDPFAAGWLRSLIAGGHIAPGDVDDRDIQCVQPDDLTPYTQCHFFAGIGGWSYALRLAGWDDARPVWTGSCPCQPFSVAGKELGDQDPRHLWPEFRRLLAERRPATVFGEQVASAAGRLWLAGVRGDLEALGYAVGAADLCAAGTGAPHIRQRLYWVADAQRGTPERQRFDVARTSGSDQGAEEERQRFWVDAGYGGQSCGLAHTNGREPGDRGLQPGGEHGQQSPDSGVGWVGESFQSGLEGLTGHEHDGGQSGWERTNSTRSTAATSHLGHWSDYVLLPCTDGKARRVEPGTFPLAHGVSNRVGLLRGYGNAIVPALAAEFIQAWGALTE